MYNEMLTRMNHKHIRYELMMVLLQFQLEMGYQTISGYRGEALFSTCNKPFCREAVYQIDLVKGTIFGIKFSIAVCSF